MNLSLAGVRKGWLTVERDCSWRGHLETGRLFARFRNQNYTPKVKEGWELRWAGPLEVI